LDKTAREIIKQLNKNPEKSYSKISEKVGTSISTVKRRFEQLKKDNVILRTTQIIDLSRIGYNGKVLLFISGSKKFNMKNVTERMGKIKNIFYFASGLGVCEMFAIGLFKKFSDIEQIINEIKMLPSVKTIKISITSNTEFPVTSQYSLINIDTEMK
jgi:DNA-binding Lrp family transcriptional regulator